MVDLLAAVPTAAFLLRNPVSSASHFLWCLFTFFAGAFLVRLAGRDKLKAISLAIFTASMVLLYFASGLYHALILSDEALHWFRLVDHSAIFLLIAGTYTPVVAVLFRGRPRVLLLGLVWAIAVVGIACKWLLRAPPYPLTVGIYIGMGWVGIMYLPAMIRALSLRGMGVVLLGGVCYTLGGVADALGWPDLWPGVIGPHEVMHVCDMAGTLVYIFVMLWYVVPHQGHETDEPAVALARA